MKIKDDLYDGLPLAYKSSEVFIFKVDKILKWIELKNSNVFVFCWLISGFSLGRLHMEGEGGWQVQGDKALIGGTHEGDIDLMGT